MTRALARTCNRRAMMYAFAVAAATVPLSTQTAGAQGDIGKAELWRRCDLDRHALNFDTCEGFASFNVLDPASAFKAGEWVAKREWSSEAFTTKRANGEPMTLRTITNPRKVPLKDLDRRALVIAHIRYNPEGPEDPVFKIGGVHTQGRRFTGDFYIVMDRFTIGDETTKGIRIANWRLFGLRTTGEFRALKANGVLRWCAPMPSHKGDRMGPLFATCATRHMLDKLAAKYGRTTVAKAIMSTPDNLQSVVGTALTPQELQAIRDSAHEARDAFASFPCAIGCCIGESGPDLPEGELEDLVARAGDAMMPFYVTRSSHPAATHSSSTRAPKSNVAWTAARAGYFPSGQ